MKKIHYICLLAIFVSFNVAQAQVSEENIIEERNENKVEDEAKLFHFNLQLKNMHLWKGLHVTDAPMTAADINYTSKNGFFKAGLWGGRGFNGDYTEFDYYVSFMHKGWSLSIWDINNYSDFPDAKIFDRVQFYYMLQTLFQLVFKNFVSQFPKATGFPCNNKLRPRLCCRHFHTPPPHSH